MKPYNYDKGEGFNIRAAEDENFVFSQFNEEALLFIQINRIMRLMSNDPHGGGQMRQQILSGGGGTPIIQEVYEQDTRIATVNAVKALFDMMSAHFSERVIQEFIQEKYRPLHMERMDAVDSKDCTEEQKVMAYRSARAVFRSLRCLIDRKFGGAKEIAELVNPQAVKPFRKSNKASEIEVVMEDGQS